MGINKYLNTYTKKSNYNFKLYYKTLDYQEQGQNQAKIYPTSTTNKTLYYQ